MDFGFKEPVAATICFLIFFDLKNTKWPPNVLIDSKTREPLMATKRFLRFPSISY
jgi:hypothetical protein